jgi:uncharacterized protein (DUF2237 family)
MNVSQALKKKNKLAIELKKQYAIAQKFNSQEAGNPRRYSVQDALDKAAEITAELIELKTRIHLANAPVYSKIFRMAELKGRIKELKKVPTDEGKHIVCAIMDDDFLQYTKSQGNDLITPYPPSFPGLVAGDKWCVCILRWIQAYKAGKAPKLIPESTNEIALKYISKDILLKYTYK